MFTRGMMKVRVSDVERSRRVGLKERCCFFFPNKRVIINLKAINIFGHKLEFGMSTVADFYVENQHTLSFLIT